MFELGDLIYCPGSDETSETHSEGVARRWCQDWGIVFKIDDCNSSVKFHVHWLNACPTVEGEVWIHKHCELAASV